MKTETTDKATPKLTVRTIHPKHIEQLGWNHDATLDITGMEILGSHQGAVILNDCGKLIRWSVTAYCQQLQSTIRPEKWSSESRAARRKANSVPSLFTDDGKTNDAEHAALCVVAECAKTDGIVRGLTPAMETALSNLAAVRKQ